MVDEFERLKQRGNELFQQQDYANALSWYDQCVSVDPANPVGHSNRAMCLIKLGRGQEALSACRDGLEPLTRLPQTAVLQKIRQKLLYRQQLAETLCRGAEWREIAVCELQELPTGLAQL